MRRATFVAAALTGLVGVSTVAWAEDRQPEYTVEELDSLSCREAWRKANRSADAFISMSHTLINDSLQQRRLVLPQDRSVGFQLGESIIKGCVDDPEEHLSSVVDREIREWATPRRAPVGGPR